MTELLDRAWFERRCPRSDGGGKDERGQALVVGSSSLVPGAILLTGEAVLRSGAGRVQLATLAEIAPLLGVAFPEAAVIGLPSRDGELTAEGIDALEHGCARCDALIVGPGMIESERTPGLVAALLAKGGDVPCLLDAGAMTALRSIDTELPGRLVLTPHHGELATLMSADKDDVAGSPAAWAKRAAIRFGAVVVLKAAETFVASPEDRLARYVSTTPGLGTAGSGDVLAGLIGGLLARGASPFDAAAMGVWLHGSAGAAVARRHGPLGFLARDLLGEIPALLRG
ncbi:NAD(P)H-hydrate dehydratase [Sphingomonas panacisoli]|uniref:ADP-dependent (S)-NAD(P)H-hydrate dehydratase n=1 Tax=Sphingomonas panacisoli TaxID=1813879 RepID=A0A5B8LF34_9SPHN|nr:NAD(P)H-hydrate dehydratase [Sphingomonas panacisoli]QDZ06797.1 NAD(P)H-hydrate dehydratase [Sphingomonas panacisoli]